MDRQSIVDMMVKRNVTPDEMYQFARKYHKEVKNVDWQPQQVNILELEHLVNIILEEGSRIFNVCLLKNANGQVIKVF